MLDTSASDFQAARTEYQFIHEIEIIHSAEKRILTNLSRASSTRNVKDSCDAEIVLSVLVRDSRVEVPA